MSVASYPTDSYGARMVPAKNLIDLELIAQRILKLAEIATLEHLEQISQSQAAGVLELTTESEAA
jgi:hypothetical protein